jgi:hypothetical protein
MLLHFVDDDDYINLLHRHLQSKEEVSLYSSVSAGLHSPVCVRNAGADVRRDSVKRFDFDPPGLCPGGEVLRRDKVQAFDDVIRAARTLSSAWTKSWRCGVFFYKKSGCRCQHSTMSSAFF